MKHFDPKLTHLVWAGISFVGFTDDMIEVTQDAPDWTLISGPDKQYVRTLNPDTMAKMVVSLQAESPTNDQLSTRRYLDRTTMLGYGPVSLTNLNSTSLVKGAQAFLEGPPAIGIKRDPEARVWTIIIPDAYIFAGGAVI